MPAPKVGGVGYGLPATVALTEPPCAMPFVLGAFKDDESPKSLSNQINHMRITVTNLGTGPAAITCQLLHLRTE